VGPGGSLEAEYKLKADVPAGSYLVVCDAIVIVPIDVTFDLVHRRDGADTTLATWMQHFEPIGGGVYKAQAYELEVPAPAINFKSGDQLVFRYTGGTSTSTMTGFIPNGDGHITDGRIPNITLPK
jgi:hypothetical protein